MPGQLLSDHYIKRMRDATKDEDRMERAKAKAEQAYSERQEANRRVEQKLEKMNIKY